MHHCPLHHQRRIPAPIGELCLQQDDHTANRLRGMTSGGWITSAATAEPPIGCWKGRRVAEAATLTRSSRCAAAVGKLSCHLCHPHPSNSPTSSRRQHRKPIGSANTFVNIIQLSRLRCSALRWTSGPHTMTQTDFPTALTPTLLRGWLTLMVLTKVDLLRDMIDLFGGI